MGQSPRLKAFHDSGAPSHDGANWAIKVHLGVKLSAIVNLSRDFQPSCDTYSYMDGESATE